MKVSVAIPVHNGERYLRQTLDSALGQSYSDVEIIVVNDGSWDGSAPILSEYGPLIRVIHQKNHGVSHARNRAVRESTGDLIALLDQDDIWHGEKLEKQVQVFLDCPDASFVYSDVDFIDTHGRVLERKASTSWKHDWMRPLLKGHFHPFPSTVLMRRDLYVSQGGFSTDFIKNTHEDVEFWARLCRVTEFQFLEEPLVQYRVDLGKVMEREGDDYGYRWRNMITLYNKLMPLYSTAPDARAQMKKVLKMEGKMEAGRLGRVGKRLALNGDVKGAREAFRDAWRLDKSKKHASRYARSCLPGSLHKYLFPK